MLHLLPKIFAAIGALLGAMSCYYTVYAIVGLFATRRFAPARRQHRYAIVIAARNEEAVIGNLVDSLLRQDYPRELYDVIVAPNNCTDGTEAVARAHGARIFRHEGRVKSKGEVLRQVVEKVVLAEGYDAMCVFDADNLVDAAFLSRMNDARQAGAGAAQGFRDSKNPHQSAVSGCYSICYWMLSHFYNNARAVLGLSALVNGSGFMVTAALLRRLGGWNTRTMTEDYEFSAQCVLAGDSSALTKVQLAGTSCSAGQTLAVAGQAGRWFAIGVVD